MTSNCIFFLRTRDAQRRISDGLEREASGRPRVETAAQRLGRRDSYVFK